MRTGPEGVPSPVERLASETGEGRDSAAAMPARIERYSQARHRAREILDYIDTLADEEAARVALGLSECGEYLKFRHYFTVDKVRLHGAKFCKQHLVCPLCAIRRGAKMLKAYLDRFEAITAQAPHLRPYLVTLTVKNGEHLGERFDHLMHGVKQLFNRRHARRVLSELRKVDGGFYSVEFTNRGNGWHPHVHMLVLAAEKPCAETLAYEWHTVTGDSFVVDVSAEEDQDPVEMFLEVCKYAMKFSDLTPEQTYLASRVLKGRRLIGSFGCFRGVDIPESLLDEPLDGLPYVDLFYRFRPGGGYQFMGVTPEACHGEEA